VAFSALRVRGVNLFIVTLAAAVAIENVVFRHPVWGGGATGSSVPSPELLGVNIGSNATFFGISGIPSPLFGILIALTSILACLFVSSLRRVNLGHRFLAVRSNERAASAAGISVRGTKLSAFAISSALAGIAGVMYAYNFGSVTAGRFSVPLAMSAIAFVYIAGITTVRGAALSGTMMVGAVGGFLVLERIDLPYELLQLVGGIALVLTIVFKPEGIAGGPLKSQTGQPTLRDRVRARRRRPAEVAS
jgi:ABC-type branched-subunit amino acid transport system permease subunit